MLNLGLQCNFTAEARCRLAVWSHPGISNTLLLNKILGNSCPCLSSCMGLLPVTHWNWSLQLHKTLFKNNIYEGSLLRFHEAYLFLINGHQADFSSLQESYGSEDMWIPLSLQWLEGGGLLYWTITCQSWAERPSYHPVFTAGHGLPNKGKVLLAGGFVWEITKERFSAMYSEVLFCLFGFLFLEDTGYWPEAVSESVDDLSLRSCE